MPVIKQKNTHTIKQPTDKDVVIKTNCFRIYFQNYYSLISLTNDFIVGVLYVMGALISLFDGPALYGNICYLLGALFLFLRPVIKIVRNIYVYGEKEYEEKTANEEEENQDSQEIDNQDHADDTIEVQKEDEENKDEGKETHRKNVVNTTKEEKHSHKKTPD